MSLTMIENLKQASPTGTEYHHAARVAELVAEAGCCAGCGAGCGEGPEGVRRRSLNRSLARRRLPGFEGLATFHVFNYLLL